MKQGYKSSLFRLLIIVVALIALLEQVPIRSHASSLFTIYLPVVSKPDLSRIAYVLDLANHPNYALCTIDPDGDNMTQLTIQTEFFAVAAPAWSPDGLQLIFSGHNIDPYNSFAIYRIDSDGSDLIKLIDVGMFPTGISWSHDGNKIVFESYTDIYVMNSDGSGLIQLTTSNHNENPTWSPNGQLIAFDHYGNGDSNIYVMNADGTNQHLVGSDVYYDSDPAWSPDGTQLAFTRYYRGASGIFVMHVDGTSDHQVASSPEPYQYIGNPTWSPDGQRIAFEGLNQIPSDIYIIDADGTNLAWLTSGTYPAWSP